MSVDYFTHKILWLNILVGFKVYYYTLVWESFISFFITPRVR